MRIPNIPNLRSSTSTSLSEKRYRHCRSSALNHFRCHPCDVISTCCTTPYNSPAQNNSRPAQDTFRTQVPETRVGGSVRFWSLFYVLSISCSAYSYPIRCWRIKHLVLRRWQHTSRQKRTAREWWSLLWVAHK